MRAAGAAVSVQSAAFLEVRFALSEVPAILRRSGRAVDAGWVGETEAGAGEGEGEGEGEGGRDFWAMRVVAS